MIKELYCNEIYPDYKVKDSSSFHRDRAKELRSLQFANVEIDGETALRPIKVQSAKPKKLKWSNEEQVWFFECKIKVKVLD